MIANESLYSRFKGDVIMYSGFQTAACSGLGRTLIVSHGNIYPLCNFTADSSIRDLDVLC